MVLQTFLLLDLWSKGRGLGVVALVCIKSASKIYYIEIYTRFDILTVSCIVNLMQFFVVYAAKKTI